MRLPTVISLWMRGSVGKGTLAVTVWQGIRVGSQALWMIAVARALGPSGYGGFAGATGLATALGSLTGMGFGLVMLQDASRDPRAFAGGWKRAIIACLTSGAILWGAFVVAAPLVVPLSTWTLAAVGIPELICFPLTIVSSYAFQSRERMGWAGAMYSLVPASNILAVTCFFLFTSDRSLMAYLPWHAGCSIAAALAGYLLVNVLLRPGFARLSVTRRDLNEAFGYSLMRVVDNGLGSLDKTLVLRLAGAEAAGIYTAAYRLVAVLALPVTSLAMAALPRLFRVGGDPDEGRHFVRRLTIFAAAGGLAAMIGVLILAEIIPWLLGPRFEASTGFARWLAPFPLLFGLSSLGCNILVTSRLRHYRIAVQLLGLVTLTGGIVALVPAFGLGGAAAALMTAHLVIVLTIWWIVRHTSSHRAASPYHRVR